MNSIPAGGASGARVMSFNGKTPRIAADAFIADTAVLIGDVEVASGAGIWFGAVLRGDLGSIRVGTNSNVQDGCVLHTDPGFPLVIGTGVTVGHRAIVHGAIVEDDVLVGMGAVLLNGSVIGAGSLVAAGAVVLAGATVPAGSLVAGVPGRVIRALDEASAEYVRTNGATYVDLARKYRSVEAG